MVSNYQPAPLYTKARPPKVTTSWVNVCRAGHSHGLHNHVGAEWSGVYYCSVPPRPKPNKRGGGGGGGGGTDDSRQLDGHLVLRICSGGTSARLGIE